MSYYIEIDGIPKCDACGTILNLEMEETLMKSVSNPGCSHLRAYEAEDAARVLRDLLPNSTVLVREGGCPSYADNQDAQADYSMTREEVLEARVDKLVQLIKRGIKWAEDLDEKFPADPGCQDCTRGCTPYSSERGPCWYHAAKMEVK